MPHITRIIQFATTIIGATGTCGTRDTSCRRGAERQGPGDGDHAKVFAQEPLLADAVPENNGVPALVVPGHTIPFMLLISWYDLETCLR